MRGRMRAHDKRVSLIGPVGGFLSAPPAITYSNLGERTLGFNEGGFFEITLTRPPVAADLSPRER